MSKNTSLFIPLYHTKEIMDVEERTWPLKTWLPKLNATLHMCEAALCHCKLFYIPFQSLQAVLTYDLRFSCGVI
jgi:hypothetical protein